MSFAPRDEKPHLIVFVSARSCIRDHTGLIHYMEAVAERAWAACRLQGNIKRVDRAPVTCFDCLLLQVKEV
jgi:hypothetical protein